MSTAWRESSQCVHEAWVTRLVQSRVGEGGEAVVVVEVVDEGEEKKGSEMGVDEEVPLKAQSRRERGPPVFGRGESVGWIGLSFFCIKNVSFSNHSFIHLPSKSLSSLFSFPPSLRSPQKQETKEKARLHRRIVAHT